MIVGQNVAVLRHSSSFFLPDKINGGLQAFRHVDAPFYLQNPSWYSKPMTTTNSLSLPASLAARDVLIIGGGPSGLMAAIAAQTAGARTVLVEKGNKLGRKLGISGGGRCNVTNAKPLPELMENIVGNSRFLYSALTRFGSPEIVAFFEDMGIALKEEDHGRVFPVTDKASTVVKALVDKVYALGVMVYQDTAVGSLICEDNQVKGARLASLASLASGLSLGAKAVVVATGGVSVPQTGSTGDGYPWAQAAGHSIVAPYPTAVPLTSPAPFIKERTLQGLSFKEVVLRIISEHGKVLTTETGDLLFSHFGLTGPAALRSSHYVSVALRKNPQAVLRAEIDFLPTQSEPLLHQQLAAIRAESGRRSVRTVLSQWVPERLAEFLCRRIQIAPTLEMAHLSRSSEGALCHALKAFDVPISGTLPLDKATVTGGGVALKAIDPRTMGSKLCRGLYFAGEVLDVHAHTGGYNITVAFSTGHLAGSAAAEYVLTHAND